MRIKRWWMIGLAAVAVALALAAFALLKPGAPAGFADEGVELIANGGFELLDEAGEPQGWTPDMWYWDEGVSELALSGEAYGGAHSVVVVNHSKNDARFEQAVAVTPGGLYEISCMVRAEGCGEDENGAGVSIADTFASSDYRYDTDGQWEKVTLYGRAGAGQTSATVMVRVGGYGSENVGRAWFDEVSMRRIAAAPAGAVVRDMSTSGPDGGDSKPRSVDDYALALFALAALLYACAAAWTAARIERPSPLRKEEGGGAGARLIVGLAIAAAVRLVIAPIVRGYPNDMDCFLSWGNVLLDHGPLRFYSSTWCDYPPGYLPVLAMLAAIRRLLGIAGDGPAAWLVVKLAPIAADLAAAALIYRLARPRIGRRAGLGLALIFAFNPAAIANSAAWGQIDSVLALCLALVLMLAAKGRWTAALPLYALSALVKPQALMFGPLGLFIVAADVARSDDWRAAARRALWGALGAVGVLLAVLLPFAALQAPSAAAPAFLRPFVWVYELYTETMKQYDNIAINAANLYTLLGMNWTMASIKLSASAYLRAGNAAILALSIGYGCLLYWRARRREAAYLAGAAMLALIFAFGMMMHERYAFPLLLLLALAYVNDRDERIMGLLILSSMAQFMNIAMVLRAHDLIAAEQAASAAVSLVNVGVALALSWVGWDVLVRRRIRPAGRTLERLRARRARPAPPIVRVDGRLKLKKLDWAILMGLTLAYSAVAFTNLGAMSAPQSSWKSAASDEQVTFDLGQQRTFHMTYYGGICDSSFTVSLSGDGQNWTEPALARYDQGEIFRWLWYVPSERDGGEFTALEAGHPMQTARYVRLTAEAAGLILSEVAFIDAGGKPYPIASAVDPDGDARPLIDEQSTVPAYPSYYNSTYFDEIYHARTGYEFLHGLRTYETTHPPLGKVLIMLGIRLFGMTPFGWRFMGALIGVMMVPAMYLMVKQLVGRTDLAAIGAFLMAADAMHFTQTRIATIDSYGVFFIMLMYLAMFRYLKMNFHYQKLWRTLIPLALSGLFMGLGIASKWIGIYAAVGLAALLFYALHRRWVEYRALGRQAADIAPYADRFGRNLAITLCCCLVFFVAVPLAIYYYSYYWQLAPEGGLSIDRVWYWQKYMLNYHASLTGDTHAFQSPWYSWPVIGWPMWFYSGTAYMPAGMVSSISCMGNPAVWWGGLAALLFVLARVLRGGDNYRYVLIGFAAQYLPWVLVPRSTFIYHYFASVPFIILCIVLALQWLRGHRPRIYRPALFTLLGAALALFVMFYPILSGAPVARSYAAL
ncbi:MAG: phospholipid carrier-dependent glycosyltransferase, partial [Clostridiales bacterium]|nr:phospholipid carrier-dependent glycosyltransferase [Clostridiales bacterium]